MLNTIIKWKKRTDGHNWFNLPYVLTLTKTTTSETSGAYFGITINGGYL